MKEIFKNIASLGVVQIGNLVLPLISVPIISRIIGPEKFGIINYCAAFVGYFTLFIAYGFDLTATRKIVTDIENIALRRKVFSEVFYAQIVLFCISSVVFLICLFSISSLSSQKYVAVFSYLTCLATLLTQNWLFQAMGNLAKVAILNLCSKIVFTITILLLVRKGNDFFWQPLILTIANILAAISSFIWAIKLYQIRLIPTTFGDVLRLIWKEKTVFLSMVVISLYTTTNTVMLGFLEGEKQVGFYTAAQKLIAIVSNVINLPLAASLYPYVGKAFADGKENGLLFVQKVIPWLVITLGTLSIALFFIGPYFLIMFYGNAFEPSIQAFRIISFVPVVIALSAVFGLQMMLNLKMDNLFFQIASGGAIIGLVMNYFMIKHLGYIGTAWNWLIVEIYITVTQYVALRYKGYKPIDFSRFKPKRLIAQLKPITTIKFKKG